jgi:hypothetical protein
MEVGMDPLEVRPASVTYVEARTILQRNGRQEKTLKRNTKAVRCPKCGVKFKDRNFLRGHLLRGCS